MMKVKISGGFYQHGDLADIRSFISTAKNRAWNVIHALTQHAQILITAPERRDPKVLARLDAVAGRVLRRQGAS